MPARRALILADDLTGAADCAAQALRHGLSAAVALRPDTGADADVLALDLDTRRGGARAAYAATRDAARGGAPLLTGGETARAVCDRVGVTAIELIAEIEPGVPLGRAGDLGIDG